MKEQRGVFVCERGQMELSQFMAERLYSGFVSKTEQREDFRIANEGYRFGGQWFCPGCGVLMNEETPVGSEVSPVQAKHREVPAAPGGITSPLKSISAI